MYTRHMDEKLAKDAFNAGVDDYFVKDDDATHYMVLSRRIRSVIDQHRMRAQLGESRV
jgi:PleD family two-component response regulator